MVRGKKIYPVGAFNKMEPLFENFRNKYFGKVIPQDTRAGAYIEAINRTYLIDGMFYAEYKHYIILKNLI